MRLGVNGRRGAEKHADAEQDRCQTVFRVFHGRFLYCEDVECAEKAERYISFFPAVCAAANKIIEQ
jgi:hypothetical protein